MENIQALYTCPSVPPEGIKLDMTYFIGKDTNGYFYSDGKKSEYCEIEYIKMLFTPVDTTWDKAFESKKK